MASVGMSINFLNFNGKYEKLDDFTLMQTFNVTLLSNEELNKLGPNFPKTKQVSFEHIYHISQEIDKNIPFSM